jgi:acetyl-CoA acetyltransferase
MNDIVDKCAIAGIGQTEYLVNSGRDPLTLALEAITNAVEDAGLNVKDIDGIVKYSVDSSASVEMIAGNLGLPNVSFWGETFFGGGSGCSAVTQAAMAVAGGMADCVVCYRSFTPYDFLQGARHNSTTLWARASGSGDFLRPFGWSAMLDVFAMMCQRHMYEYGTTSSQLGAIAVAARKHAAMNPNSIRKTPITLEDHQNSPFVSEPLRELDCLIAPNDGACAVIITSAERAKDLKQQPAYIRACTQTLGVPKTALWWEQLPFKTKRPETQAAYVAPRLFEMAGLTPQDIDVAQIYDCYTYTVLTQLEDYGFCEKGEGGAFVEDGRIEIGGELPVNTHGGHLGEAYIHGFTHILEGVKQVRGTSTAQVKDAETVLVTGGVPAPTAALILRR